MGRGEGGVGDGWEEGNLCIRFVHNLLYSPVFFQNTKNFVHIQE
jgi:hypothetical protein